MSSPSPFAVDAPTLVHLLEPKASFEHERNNCRMLKCIATVAATLSLVASTALANSHELFEVKVCVNLSQSVGATVGADVATEMNAAAKVGLDTYGTGTGGRFSSDTGLKIQQEETSKITASTNICVEVGKLVKELEKWGSGSPEEKALIRKLRRFDEGEMLDALVTFSNFTGMDVSRAASLLGQAGSASAALHTVDGDADASLASPVTVLNAGLRTTQFASSLPFSAGAEALITGTRESLLVSLDRLSPDSVLDELRDLFCASSRTDAPELTQKLQELCAVLDDSMNTAAGLASTIDTINETATGINEATTTIDETTTTINKTTTAIDRVTALLASDISGLTTDVGQVRGRVDDVADLVGQSIGAVNTLSSEMDSALEPIDSAIDAVRGDLEPIEEGVDDVESMVGGVRTVVDSVWDCLTDPVACLGIEE